MILSDKKIKEFLRRKEIVIKPLNKKKIQSSSVDLRLGKNFLVADYHNVKCISLDENLPYRQISGSEILIPSHHFVLGTTFEHIELPDYISGKLDGKSSIGRKGLYIQNAGHVAPGFKGNITLELYNANELPFEIKSGKGICQIVFEMIDQPVEKPYNGKYQGQIGTTSSK